MMPSDWIQWCRVLLAPTLALAAAAAYSPARRWGARGRAAAWLSASTVVALSPCLVPLSARPLRLVAALVAIGMLVKLFDVFRSPARAGDLTRSAFLAYLANVFWLVLRKPPPRVAAARDLRSLAWGAPLGVAAALWAALLWNLDWSAVAFPVEHAAKTSAAALAVTLAANLAASVWRLLGGSALDPMRGPLLAATPAEFWRRWNLPAQQFFQEYAFLPAGGLHRPRRATLLTFAASGLVHEYVFGIAAGRPQGWQLLFFLLHGCAAAASLGRRPRGRMVPLATAATAAFNLLTSALFFQSLDAILPFYQPPGE